MTRHPYLDDPWTTEFPAKIVSIGESHGLPVVVLDRSWFYPESGGQRADRGFIDEIEVVDVQEHGDVVHHVVDRAVDPSLVGREILARIDVERRLDHMRHHTGQHALSAAFLEELGAQTISFHMGDETCTIDLDRAELTPDEIARVEDRANRTVMEDHPIHVLYPDPQELAALHLRKDPSVSGQVRVVEIEGIDRSACGGTHCSRTGQIGPIHVCRFERVRQRVRVHFTAGQRSIAGMRVAGRLLAGVGGVLSAHDTEIEARVRDLVERVKQSSKELEAIQAEVAGQQAAAMLETARWIGAFRFVARRHEGPAPALKGLGQRLVKEPDLVAILTNDAGDVLVGCGSGTGLDAGKLVKELVGPRGGKGGGQPNLAQGRVEPSQAEAVAADLGRRLAALAPDPVRLGRYARNHATEDGTPFRVREALPADAPIVVPYVTRLLEERLGIFAEPGDFTTTVDECGAKLATFRGSDNSIHLLAETQGELIGLVDLRGGARRRIRHSAELGMTVARQWRRRGVGHALLADTIDWCRKSGTLQKIHLGVFADNAAARLLYESFGFVEEGRISRAFVVDGRLVDEVRMGLWLGPSETEDDSRGSR